MSKLNLITAEELRSNFVPKYNPFFSIIPNRQAHSIVYQSVNIQTSQSLGDVLARKVGIGDTERAQVISGRRTKSFNKEFKGIKYKVNMNQDMSDYQDIVNSVVNANLKQFDREVFRGSDNNGLFISSDPDFHENSGVAMTDLDSAYAGINDVLLEAEIELGNGMKYIAPYGDFRTLLNTFNTNEQDTFLNILKRQFSNVQFVEVPAGLVDSGEKGFLCIASDYVKMHYTQLPQALANGQNIEDNYVWTNIGYGTANIECAAPKAIIKQPKS